METQNITVTRLTRGELKNLIRAFCAKFGKDVEDLYFDVRDNEIIKYASIYDMGETNPDLAYTEWDWGIDKALWGFQISEILGGAEIDGAAIPHTDFMLID